jgi:PAS domain S-box-containing protein
MRLAPSVSERTPPSTLDVPGTGPEEGATADRKEDVRPAEDFFRQVFEAAPDAFVLADTAGVIVLVNARTEEMFDYQENELIGRPVEVLVPDRFREAYAAYRTDDRGDPVSPAAGGNLDLRGRRRDGTEFPVEISLSPLQTAEGRLVIATLRDTTARQRAIEVRSNLASIVECSGDAIIGKTLDGVVLSWNAGATSMYGYEGAEIVGRSVRLLVPPDRHAELEWILECTRRGERVEHLETVRLRKDGSRLDVSITASPIRDASGNVIRLATISRDITARKRAEERSRSLAAELEERVEKRTAELRRSLEELQHFAYVASHDLKEPLRMVAGFTQLLADRYGDELDTDGKEFIAYAVDGATRMQSLIDDLFLYSKIGTEGKSFVSVDTSTVVDGVLANLRLAVEESGAVVTRDTLPVVWADETQLGQVFQNLLGNAIKFRGERAPEIHVGATRGSQAWVFSVEDNGIGIDPKYSDRIFEMFQRLHRATAYPGTGIGLAICKKIVAQHGGAIWFSSRPKEGTTFYFSIPMEPRVRA